MSPRGLASHKDGGTSPRGLASHKSGGMSPRGLASHRLPVLLWEASPLGDQRTRENRSAWADPLQPDGVPMGVISQPPHQPGA